MKLFSRKGNGAFTDVYRYQILSKHLLGSKLRLNTPDPELLFIELRIINLCAFLDLYDSSIVC